MQHLFKSPKPNNSADPGETFKSSLFVFNSKRLTASPIAYTAKNPVGPLLGEPMSSRLRNTGNISLLDLGSCEPQRPTTRKQASRKRKTTSTTATRRSMRSKSNVVPKPPQPEATIMTYHTRSKAANTELSQPEPKPTRVAAKTKQPAVRVTRVTRSKAQSLTPSESGVAVIASKAIKDEREPDVKPTSAVTNKKPAYRQHDTVCQG